MAALLRLAGVGAYEHGDDDSDDEEGEAPPNALMKLTGKRPAERSPSLHPASLETDARPQRASLSSTASATPWAAASRGRGLLSPTLHSLRLAPTGLNYYPVPTGGSRERGPRWPPWPLVPRPVGS